MKTWKKILLLVGVLLLAFGLTVLQIAHHRGEGFLIAPTKLGLSNVSGLSYDQKGYTVCSSGEERFAAKDVKSLDVDWLSGAADVERYDGREVVIRETAGARLTEDQCMRWKLKDGALSILPCANRVRELPEKRLSVLVPRDLTLESANVDVASASCSLRGIEADGKLSLGSASGSLAVEDCRCGELELDSASGSQSVLRTEVSGKTDADLASGSFTADTLACGALRVSSSSGSQEIGALRSDSVELGVSSGSIRASGLICRSIRTDGASGSVRLGFAAAPERVEVDSSSGSVTLSFPKGTGLDLDYDSGSGKLRGEVIYGDLPVKVDTGSGSLTIEYK